MTDHARYRDFSNGAPADLVAEIYEAAARPDCLSPMAQILAQVADAGTGVVYLFDSRSVQVSTFGLPEAAGQEYLRYYHWVNPWFNKAVELGLVEGLYRSGELVAEAEFRQTEFFVDFARRFDTVEAIGGNFSLGGRRGGAIGVHRSDRSRQFRDGEFNRLVQLTPHLQSALRLQGQLGTVPSARLGLAALDALAIGAVVCDGAGRIRFANRAAEDAAAAGCGIVLGNANHGVGALLPQDARRLAVLVGEAAAGLPGGGVSLLAPGGRRCLVLVTPLPATFGIARGFALLTFRVVDALSGLNEPALRRLFDLTQAEAALALSLLNGRSLSEIGAEREVTENTLRTQLGQVLRKTGTTNQRELVRLLGLLPALRPTEEG